MGQVRIALEPIGFVSTEYAEEGSKKRTDSVVSRIVLKKKYTKGLRGIEGYSHLFVLYYMHKVEKSERSQLLTRPKHRKELPEVGIFSTRQRNHPNPIGLTLVELLRHEANTLQVKNLDAFDGTPVLDIKPCNHRDIPRKIRLPSWWLRSQS